jgi:hypothetical protein
VDREARANPNQPSLIAGRPHDHLVVGQDAGVLQLPLVRIPNRDFGRLCELGVRADGK